MRQITLGYPACSIPVAIQPAESRRPNPRPLGRGLGRIMINLGAAFTRESGFVRDRRPERLINVSRLMPKARAS